MEKEIQNIKNNIEDIKILLRDSEESLERIYNDHDTPAIDRKGDY